MMPPEYDGDPTAQQDASLVEEYAPTSWPSSEPGVRIGEPARTDGNGSTGGSPIGDRPSAPETTRQLRVALVNDYELVVRGLHAMLAPYGDRVVVVAHDVADDGTDGDGAADVDAGGGLSTDGVVDIALFDTFAARRDTLTRAEQMIAADNVRHVVLYTWDAPPEFVQQARELGVDGVIPKTATAEELVTALERVAAGERVGLDDVVKGERSRVDGPELTVREQEVLALLALGLSNAEIAHELFLSVDTIKTHVRRVFTKLGVNNRTQAAMRVVTSQSGLHRPITRPNEG